MRGRSRGVRGRGAIRVFLVDDHAAFREPLAFMLAREPDIEVIGQAGTIAEALPLLIGLDVAVFDLELPDGNGVELVRALRDREPAARCMILTASGGQLSLAPAVEAGAAALLHKSARLDQIIDAIRRLHRGEQLLTPVEIIAMLRLAMQQREESREAQAALARLTPRERDVLQALADGLNDREIGQRLSISTETVRTHMVNLLAKLGVESRLQALVFALRHGAVRLD